MSQTPFMQLYVGDYLADTLHLTTEQHGAYLLLLMTMWRNGASLPNDAAKLARICRVSPKRWPQIWSEIAEFFTVEGDTITQLRLSKEHQKAVSISQERKTAASLGGKAKALKDKEARLANGSDLPCHSQKPEVITIKSVDVGDSARGDFTLRERILDAIGIDPVSGLTGQGGRMIGTSVDMAEVDRWKSLPGMTDDRVVTVVRECMPSLRGQPPKSFKYFTPAMQQLSAQLSAPALQPATIGTSPPPEIRPDRYAPPRSNLEANIAKIRAEMAAKGTLA